MISASFMPSPPLRHLARGYHIRHFIFEKNHSTFKPYAARPEQSIVFFPRQPEIVEYVCDGRKLVRPNVMVMNQFTVRTNRYTANDFLVIIIELQPGILYQLCGFPLHSLTNTDIEGDVLFSSEALHASQRLGSTEDYGEMIVIIEEFLSHLASRLKGGNHAVDKVAHFITSQNGVVSIDWLASQACLGPRQLERKFKERLGVGPKTYARLTRMHQTYKYKSAFPEKDWLDIALCHGYNDYQHLSKDYLEFAGCTPREYFLGQTRSPEKVCGLTESFSD